MFHSHAGSKLQMQTGDTFIPKKYTLQWHFFKKHNRGLHNKLQTLTITQIIYLKKRGGGWG